MWGFFSADNYTPFEKQFLTLVQLKARRETLKDYGSQADPYKLGINLNKQNIKLYMYKNIHCQVGSQVINIILAQADLEGIVVWVGGSDFQDAPSCNIETFPSALT